jgi:hypothetical protein
MHNSVFTPLKYVLAFWVFMLTTYTAQGVCLITDSTITTSICSGDTFYVGAYAHTQTNTYTDTLVNAAGCDSIVTLNLTVIPPVAATLADTICSGDTAHFNGKNLTVSGTYADTAISFTTGCDSITTLTLTVIAPVRTTIGDTICTGDIAYFNGRAYTISGAHKDTLTSVSGCDSIVTFNLLVRPVLTGSISQSVCRGGSYNFNGTQLMLEGTYIDTLTNGSGCDSVITLTLTYNPDVPHNISVSICQGSSYAYNGDTLIYSGVYNDTLVASTGCDSLVVLTLNIMPNPIEPYVVASGDTLTASAAPAYQWVLNGSAIAGDTGINLVTTQTGDYQVEITGPNGCKNTSAAYYENALGINNVQSAWNVKLYPNPNNGTFIIAFSDNVTRVVQITDALDRVIMADEIVSGTKEFNLTALAGGVYFTRIKQQDEIRTIRFVIAK